MNEIYTLYPSVIAKNHHFQVPLNYQAAPNDESSASEQIEVFARELVTKENEAKDLPFLVYFQGGPGFGSPRPTGHGGWIKRALQEFRVLLLDQRGTGLSTCITTQTLNQDTPEAQAEYMTHFRADSIVQDAEFIRKELIGDAQDSKWSILGQSFGGFCCLNYLSSFPESLEEVFITGGIPSLSRHADDVYRSTYKTVKQKNELFFAQFPQAQNICKDVAAHLESHDIRLVNGQRITVEQFQQIGLELGGTGGAQAILYLLEQAFITINGQKVLSDNFLNSFYKSISFHNNPIFAILHEAIYCQHSASNWSAQRILESDYPEFNYDSAKEKEFLFTGEMIYPWMFDQFESLKPMKEAAEILATKSDWPMLYDVEKLANNTVPVGAAVYYNDMYVDIAYSMETIEQVANIHPWISNEYEHNGLRMDGDKVLSKLIDLVRS